MFFEEFETLERKLQRQQIAIKKAQEQQSLQHLQIQQFYADNGIDLQVLAEKMQEEQNFSADSWRMIEEKRKEFGFMPLSAKKEEKKQQERKITPFSLFCR